MHNTVMCTLSLYDVIGITGHLHIKLKSFPNIAQPLHKEAVRGCSFLYIIAKKSVIMRGAFLVDVSEAFKAYFIYVFLNITETKLFHFHMLFKNGGLRVGFKLYLLLEYISGKIAYLRCCRN